MRGDYLAELAIATEKRRGLVHIDGHADGASRSGYADALGFKQDGKGKLPLRIVDYYGIYSMEKPPPSFWSGLALGVGVVDFYTTKRSYRASVGRVK